jgi:ComF family protein
MRFVLFTDLVAYVLSPPRCAACDREAPFRTVFCAPCASTLVRHPSSEGVFEYGGAIARAIHRFKYRDRPDLGRPLGEALARIALPDVDGIVPVPLHPKRLAERGYNQAALLARPLARVMGVPVRADILSRTRDTPRQAELDRTSRQQSIRGAFHATPDARGKRWLLVDDVRTTGATLRTCAHALRDAGAQKIAHVVLAVAV